jgi:hypothetical protein
MNWRGPLGEKKGGMGGWGDGGERGFSLMPTRVKSGQASHHSARRGFPSKYKRNI